MWSSWPVEIHELLPHIDNFYPANRLYYVTSAVFYPPYAPLPCGTRGGACSASTSSKNLPSPPHPTVLGADGALKHKR